MYWWAPYSESPYLGSSERPDPDPSKAVATIAQPGPKGPAYSRHELDAPRTKSADAQEKCCSDCER